MRKLAAGLVVALLLGACTSGGSEQEDAVRGLAGQGGVMGVAAAALISFDACPDLLDYVRGVAEEQVGPYGLEGGVVAEMDMMDTSGDGGDATVAVPRAAAGEEMAATSDDAAGSAPVAGQDFTTTNVQEEGVDEPDVTKTDGELLVSAVTAMPSGDAADPYATVPRLQVVDVTGDTPALVGALDLVGWQPQLLMDGDRVLVLSPATWEEVPEDARPEDLGTDGLYMDVTRLDVVDLADPSNPQLVSTRVVEGSYVSARLVDGVVRLVTRSQPRGLVFTYPESGEQAEIERAEAENRRIVADAPVEAYLPRTVSIGADGSAGDVTPAVACEDVSRPAEPHGLGVVTVQTVDLASGEPAGPATAVVADGDTIYASRDTLYVALGSGGGMVGRPVPMPIDPMPMPEPMPAPEEPLPDEPAPAPDPDEPVPAEPEPEPAPDEPIPVEPDGGPGSGGGEPDQPIPVEPDGGIGDGAPAVDLPGAGADTTTSSPAQPPTVDDSTSAPAFPEIRTEVHAFDISDPTTATYVASGAVEGTLLNQFAMSEHEGHLRIATTLPYGVEGATDGVSESAVTVLARDGGELTQVGQVTGLGRTERIYAVRFMGPVGYVVTFRETDPLYTVDLSDPAEPRVAGELKIPGFSSYLHPVGDGLLLGIGQDASETGQQLGAQASLFDVGDLAAPERIATADLGAGSTTGAEMDHHAFMWWGPANLAVLPVIRWETDAGVPDAAAVALRVDPAGEIAEVGRVTHPVEDGAGPGGATAEDRNMMFPGINQIQRSLVIGDRLYTVSNVGVKASDLSTFDDEAWIAF